jgi:hypothetical protein
MIRRSRRLLCALAIGPILALASCHSFSWKGREVGDPEETARGIKSVEQLRNEYEAARYWNFWRKNHDGRYKAWARDWSDLHRSMDRQLFNYDWDDPYIFD